MYFSITITLFAWTAHKLACSSRPTRNASLASCSTFTAIPWNLRLDLCSWTISLTSLWKGRHLMRSSVLVWYFLISFNALIPLFIFFTSFFCSASPSPSSPFSYLFFPLISLTLLTFSFFIYSCSAWVCICFTLCAESSNRDRFYVITSIPMLRLLITN